jgi:hypothetical protein
MNRPTSKIRSGITTPAIAHDHKYFFFSFFTAMAYMLSRPARTQRRWRVSRGSALRNRVLLLEASLQILQVYRDACL